tara:strand:- start:620 stop:1093 length:474 start_codon:yes stop_codon:yes gene_type:complete
MNKTLILACALLASFVVQSQDTVAVSGGEGAGSGGTLSYTLGQVFYNAATETDGSVSQGVQQGIELNTFSNPELTTVNLNAVSYPNPTTDYVVLNISDSSLTNLSYTIMDVQGKVLSNGQISNSETHIGMQNLSLGIYMLKVNQNNTELKTFKIIKK